MIHDFHCVDQRNGLGIINKIKEESKRCVRSQGNGWELDMSKEWLKVILMERWKL